MDFDAGFFAASLVRLLAGVPITLELSFLSVALGVVLGFLLALMRISGRPWLDIPARTYGFLFRGSPLLVQIFIIYYGLGQFPAVRESCLWPYLREAFWCATLAMTLNTAAYGCEIIRGGLLSVPAGQIEAARACGMPPMTLYRRIIVPQALRQMLPAYSNEVILILKDTALASTVTLMEVTGVAAKLISESYRSVEVFVCAGAIYLALNFLVTRLFAALERAMARERRPIPAPAPKPC
jgi:octopine/nopaline transport system permease protein